MSKTRLAPASAASVPAEHAWLRWGAPACVAIATFIVFLPALNGVFLDWDDLPNLTNNPLYRGLGWEQLKWMFTTFHMGHYQPLSWLTFGADYLLWGMTPAGYHLTSILLHSANAAVFYLLCLRLLTLSAGSRPPASAEARLSAAFAALFFSLHPLRVESVAWVTERRDVLSGLFYLLAMLWYLRARQPGEEDASFWRRHLLPFSAFFLSLLSKAIAISMPAALILADIYPLRRLPAAPARWAKREYRRLWLEKLPYLAAAVLFAAMAYMAQSRSGAIITAYDRATHILFALFFYLWKTLVPLGLAPYYRMAGGLASWEALRYAVFVAAVAAAAFAARRKYPAVPAALAYFLITISPVANIVKANLSPAADRYSYLPCLGFAALAGGALLSGLRHSSRAVKKTAVLSACLMLLILGLLSREQIKIWQNSETLWEHTLLVDPEIESAHYNLAILAAGRDDLDLALKHSREALRIKPKYTEAYTNLCAILARQGKLDEAVSQCREALRLKPDFPVARFNMGVILTFQKKFNEAIPHYLEVLRLKPGHEQARFNLALALKALGRDKEAIPQYIEALRLDPGNAAAHYELCVLLAGHGRRDEAVTHCREAVRLDPDNARARARLAALLKKRAP